MSPQTASIIAAAVASAPAWAMFANNRSANRRHGRRITELHEKVDRLAPAPDTTTAEDGGGAR